MNQKKAVQQIELIKDQIGRTKRIPGRAKHLNTITHLRDLVARYKDDGIFYGYCVNQAEQLLRTYQEELDREDQVAPLPDGS